MKDIQSAISRIKSHFLLEGSAELHSQLQERQLTVLNMPFLTVVFVGL